MGSGALHGSAQRLYQAGDAEGLDPPQEHGVEVAIEAEPEGK